MSEEDKFKAIIQEIKETFLLLTEGEPSPDDEIEARTNLIQKIQNLKSVNSFQVGSNMRLFEDVLTKLENWDTLDIWFTESELPEDIKEIINITEQLPEVEVKEQAEEISIEQAKSDLNEVQIDITKIVDQVSDKFKGEIDDLKEKVEFLKHELEVKDETLKHASRTRIVKKITPKKDGKLPPPKIKIPVIKRPKSVPQVKKQIEAEKPKEKVGIKPIEEVRVKIEEEIAKLKPTQPSDEKPKIYEEMHKEEDSVLNVLEEMEPIESKLGSELLQELPQEPESIVGSIDEYEEKIEDSKKSKIVTEVTLVEEQPTKQQNNIPFVAKKPTIKAVSVEEIESESIKSSGNELFNVFSSVGSKSVEKPSVTIKLPSLDKKKKKEGKKKKKEPDTMAFVDFSGPEPQISSEDSTSLSMAELPKDKDSLYQELIALEGRRYSLEKNYKEIEKSFSIGSVNDFEYKKRSDDLQYKLDEITSQINRIRRVIASM